MVYMGSKNKLSKYLKPLIEGFLKQGMLYIEPFVGGANMIDKIDWTGKYNIKEKFDYDHFLKKCEEWYKDGNIVLLSGNFIPNNSWRVLFEKDYKYSMYDRTREVKELLMIYEPKKCPNCWFWNHHR